MELKDFVKDKMAKAHIGSTPELAKATGVPFEALDMMLQNNVLLNQSCMMALAKFFKVPMYTFRDLHNDQDKFLAKTLYQKDEVTEEQICKSKFRSKRSLDPYDDDIHRMILEGKTYKEIGEKLKIAFTSISHHVSSKRYRKKFGFEQSDYKTKAETKAAMVMELYSKGFTLKKISKNMEIPYTSVKYIVHSTLKGASRA